MADVAVKRFEELPSYKGEGQFVFAAKGLGVTAWGMNVLQLPAGWADYPEHDHVEDGQEEVYLVLKGSATLQVGEDTWELAPGTLARVGAAERRKLVPGVEGVTLLAIGGTPGQAYTPPAWMAG